MGKRTDKTTATSGSPDTIPADLDLSTQQGAEASPESEVPQGQKEASPTKVNPPAPPPSSDGTLWPSTNLPPKPDTLVKPVALPPAISGEDDKPQSVNPKKDPTESLIKEGPIGPGSEKVNKTIATRTKREVVYEERIEKVITSLEQDDMKLAFIPERVSITSEEVYAICVHFANYNNIGLKVATVLIFLLFLKGAANKGAPNSISASINLQSGITSATKEDLLSSYKKVTGNEYLRRLAEYFATRISKFAQKYSFDGDLAQQIATTMKSTDPPLTPDERAWCSSFNQKNPDCYNLHPRVTSLLIADYNKKFNVKKKENNSKETKQVKSSPRKGQKPKKGKKPPKKG